MNNQMPYIDNFYMEMNNPNQNNPWINIERINNRISRLERQVRILENRINRLTNNNPTFLKNDFDDNNNMYML